MGESKTRQTAFVGARRPPHSIPRAVNAVAAIGAALGLFAACASTSRNSRTGASSTVAGTAAAQAEDAGSAPQRRALVLSGGGPTGRAFEVGILKGLRDAGVDVTQPDLVVGTSAGGVLGSQLRAGDSVDAMYDALLTATDSGTGAPTDVGFDPAYFLQTVQILNAATDVTPDLRVEIGNRALAAPKAMSMDDQLHFIDTDLGGLVHHWPSQPLELAAADVSTGTMRFFDSTQNAPIELALAASSALPGRVAPIDIGEQRYMDGMVGGACPTGCWPNLDGAAGYDIIVVIMTGDAPPVDQEVARMRSLGSKLIVISPNAEAAAARGQNPFDLSRLGPAAEAARHQATSLAGDVRNLWNQSPTSTT